MEKSKVLLLTSCFEDIVTGNTLGKIREQDRETTHYPIGLAYLASYIESVGVDVQLLDLNYKDFDTGLNEIINTIKTFSPDVIGLQLLTANRVSGYRLIEYVHKNYPEIKIVLGGIHSTIMYNQLIKKYPFITVVLGEGEITFEELIPELKKSSPNFKNIDGLAFWDDELNDVNRTKPRAVIKDLDSLPFPKHELFFKGTRTSACILTSRGCPYSCSYCCLNPEAKRMVRFRSPKNVVDEIEYIVNTFPQLTEIWIHDDSFFLNNQRVIEICDEIIKRKIKTNFLCSGRMKPISMEMIKKLEEANFKIVALGIESGDNEILRRCHKGINQEDIINAFKLFAKSKITLKTFLIVGLPGETFETIKETGRLIQKIQKIKYVSYPKTQNMLCVYPGTEVYEIAKRKGVIDDSFWLSDQEVPLYLAEHSHEELKELGNVLSDYISYYRLRTWKGFKCQYHMIPSIVKYIITKLIERYFTKK